MTTDTLLAKLDKRQSGIYIIRRTNSSECYVGSAVSILNRWSTHKWNLKRGAHHSTYMQNVFNKYGCVFEYHVLELVEKVEDLIAREQFWIDLHKPVYNTAKVAGSTLGVKQSDEAKAKQSLAQTGRKFSQETRAAIAAAKKGKKFSPEHLASMSAVRKGVRHSQEHCANISASLKGRIVSQETREAISMAQKGYQPSLEVRAKLSAAHKGRRLSADHRAALSAARKGKALSPERRAAMVESWVVRRAKKLAAGVVK